MDRHIGVYLHTLFKQQRLICCNIVSYLDRPHTKEAVFGICAERLLIEEIAPAAYSLPYQQAERADIEQICKIYLAYPGADPAADEGADDTAVNGDAAVPDGDYLAGVLRKIIPLKGNIIEPCAHYAEDGAPDKNIRHTVKAHFPLIGGDAAVNNGERKAEGDNDAIPVNFIAAD